MRLTAITALADPAGNRISLSWKNSDQEHFPGVRVMRRTGRYPSTPADGHLVAEGTGLEACVDSGLFGETTYYYSLFARAAGTGAYDIDDHNRVSALSTSPFDTAGQMYALLPALYQRYDTQLPAVVPPSMAPLDATRGSLRRLLDLPGGQLDQLRSITQSLLDQHDVDRVDGALLPLLAQWIGWQLDQSVDLASRRTELREAPAIYRTVGLVPALEATVRRVLGRASRTKEFRDNVAHTNAPERRTIWARQRTGAGAGTWSQPVTPLSLDFAYHGRPAAVRDAGGFAWLFYHTLRSGRWQVWSKTSKAADGDTFFPSGPLSPGGADQLHPTAAVQGGRLWVFWSAYDRVLDRWQVYYRTRENGTWSDETLFGDAGTQRRRPTATADGSGGVWLFWQELLPGGWTVRYARHDGAAWSAAVTFPLDGGASPGVDDDPIAMGGASGSPARLWLFWSRREASGRWSVVYRTKSTLAVDGAGWSAVTSFTAQPSAFDDREPAPAVVASQVELFWSSNRGGAWSLWHSTFNVNGTWSAADQVTTGAYSDRGSMALPTPSRLWLFSGSNRPVTYASDVYRATSTVDRRYSGSTTVDTRNTEKVGLRGHLDDFATYTYATGDRYAYDAVGVFLAPGIDPPELAGRSAHLDVVKRSLSAFLPAQVRVILIDSAS